MNKLLLISAAVLSLAGCAAANKPAAPTPAPIPGPAPDTIAGNACKADGLADKTLVGKTEQEAGALLNGCAWRLLERDGQRLPATMDYRLDRRNLGIANGRVIWVTRG
ncbi:hypothetical protein QU481_06320 [Crenobacter sp. SG2303]|uniref:Lipoprotein n=1 Tax=Crenobacter oryzisoli TaxID=3056844 RepID=A0ABT7XL40_9NEIS|nr:hypothetical protein [Crenobacter sp. SG2303]MDN0074511.1 hypothetical protein [Crenobacter sp. SG2303]